MYIRSVEQLRQELEFKKQGREHGLDEEDLKQIKFGAWTPLGFIMPQMPDAIWEKWASNQQAPHRAPIVRDDKPPPPSDPVGLASEMDQIDNLGSIELETDQHVADAKDRKRIDKLVRG